MPFFPELLYQISARDQQVTWLDPQIRQVSNSAAAAAVAASFAVPDGRAFLVTNFGMDAVPGAGQNVSMMQLYIVDPGQNIQYRVRRDDADLAANIIGNLYASVELVIPPDWLIVAGADFNAGVAANQVLLHVFGMQIPIGNISRV